MSVLNSYGFAARNVLFRDHYRYFRWLAYRLQRRSDGTYRHDASDCAADLLALWCERLPAWIVGRLNRELAGGLDRSTVDVGWLRNRGARLLRSLRGRQLRDGLRFVDTRPDSRYVDALDTRRGRMVERLSEAAAGALEARPQPAAQAISPDSIETCAALIGKLRGELLAPMAVKLASGLSIRKAAAELGVNSRDAAHIVRRIRRQIEDIHGAPADYRAARESQLAYAACGGDADGVELRFSAALDSEFGRAAQ